MTARIHYTKPSITRLETGYAADAAANAITNRAGSLVVYGPNGLEAGRQRFERALDVYRTELASALSVKVSGASPR